MATQGLTSDEQKAVMAFRAEVVEPSMTRLVILDFWAEWCGPCKQLAPVLEKVAADYAEMGVRLVKINVDENGFIASQFQVRSIPTVYAIFQGQPVADLTPARTEGQLKQMLDQLLAQLPVQAGADGEAPPVDVAPMVTAAEDAMAAGHHEDAYFAFAEVLQIDPEHGEATGGLIRALIALDRVEEAEAILGSLPETLATHAAVERARAAAVSRCTCVG